MSFKTTLCLLLLAAAGAGVWTYVEFRQPSETASPAASFLSGQLIKDKLTKIEIAKGGETKVTLVKPAGQKDWTLPGQWPVRSREVERLVDLLTSLRTRFTPHTLEAGKESQYGLDQPLTVTVHLGDKESHTLAFGEAPAADNRFSTSTWLRLDGGKELLRLAPGLVAQLDPNQEYLQQRRLFAVERVPNPDNPLDKVEQLVAQSIQVEAKDMPAADKENPLDKFFKKDNPFDKLPPKDQGQPVAFTLVKQGDVWELAKPYKDRLDPDKLKSLLAVLPDLWVEGFVDKDKKDKDLGLEKPDYTITVKRPDGGTATLLVGNKSGFKQRKVTRPGPPPQFPGMPQKNITDIVTEEKRYARLKDNDQVFEIMAEKLKDLAVPLDLLRDLQVARFKTDDARRLEIKQGDQVLTLVKDKDKWRLEKPLALDADTSQVNDLLDKLADLKIKGKDDVIDQEADVKKLNLNLAVIQVDLEETKSKGDAKTTQKKVLTFYLGQDAKDKGKVLVRLEGWPRVNIFDDVLLKLVQRPALAYRSKRVLDLAAGDLAKIEISKGAEAYALEQTAGAWRLAAPAAADLDAAKVVPLAGDLARLEAADFVTDSPKAEDLDKTYGLAKPALQVKLTFADAKKPPLTLSVGNIRKDKQDYFARIDNGPVFVVKKDLRDTLERDSLSYRPLQLWQIPGDNITEMVLQKGAQEFRLKKVDKDWKLSGPFEATAVFFQADTLADDLASIKAEKYVAHAPKDLKTYGLDQPAFRVRVVSKPGKDAKETPKERTLLIGQPTEKDAKTRFAKLGDGDGVFVVDEKVLKAIDRNAYDFLDKTLVNILPSEIKKIRSTVGSAFTLEPKDKAWQVIDSPAPPFVADADAVQKTLRALGFLQAARVVDYGPKIDWSKYGLEKPSTITVTVGEDKNKTVDHILALGSPVGTSGERYARADKQDMVVVLPAALVRDLAVSYLEFVDPQVFKFAFDAVTGLERKMSGAGLELIKKDDQWKVNGKMADEATVGDLLDKTFRLRAKRIAAYPAKDLKEFGLDAPAAVWTIRLDMAGKPSQHVLKVGSPALDTDKKDGGERYAQVDGSQTVVVLPAELSKHLVGSALHFADRGLASFAFADKAMVDHKGRKATFERVDGVWQITAPIRVEAEDNDLDDLIKEVKRLRADELIAEKADLAKYGLDNPMVQWKFFSGDKEVLNLAVGKAEPGKGHYGRLGGGDVVFLLGAKTAERLLDEYRRRKPWPSLDAAQVEKLLFQGANPFTLIKKDGAWQLDGKAEVKIDPKAVSETLDALARLKVQRFAADAKADLKLYGLDPPVWTIEAHTAALKRTLLIGRAEGDSQRYYATTPGNDAVFILGEDDSRKIVRPLPGFLVNQKTGDKEKK